jgi:hypothetical protein
MNKKPILHTHATRGFTYQTKEDCDLSQLSDSIINTLPVGLNKDERKIRVIKGIVT